MSRPRFTFCRDLLEERARITIYDPQVSLEKIRKDLEYIMAGPGGVLTEAQRDLLYKKHQRCIKCRSFGRWRSRNRRHD